MQRLSVVAIALGALLCAAVPAHGKGVSAATVCGADTCRDVTDQSRLQFFGPGGTPAAPPSSATGWYRVTVTIGVEGGPPEQRFTLAALPDIGVYRDRDGAWMSMYDEAARAYRDTVRGLEPLPVSQLGLTPPPAVDTGGADRDGVPWVLVGVGAAVALAAVALSPPVRRRLAAP